MRSEGRIYTSRWDDVDWTDVAYGPQWLYDLLLSQADLEHHGVIALRVPRWAQMARDMTEALVSAFLDELAERRFVVVDPAYGEVLVRSLVRQDKVYKQPNVLRSAADRLGQVKSPIIRAALHAELQRIAQLPDLTEMCALIVKEMLDATQPGAAPVNRRARPRPAKTSGNPSAKSSRTASPDSSRDGRHDASAKASAYQSSKPSGERLANASADADFRVAASATAKGSGRASANPSATHSADPRPSGPGAGSADRSSAAQPPGRPAGDQSAPRPARPAPMRDWAAIDAAVAQIIETWTATLDTPPSPHHTEDIGFRIAEALTAGHRPEHVAVVLAAWQADGGTDPEQLSVLIDTLASGKPTDGEPHQPDALAEAPRDAHEWLQYAPQVAA